MAHLSNLVGQMCHPFRTRSGSQRMYSCVDHSMRLEIDFQQPGLRCAIAGYTERLSGAVATHPCRVIDHSTLAT